MSSMWSVSVINRGKKWIDLEVVMAHPDAGYFSEDPGFALALLTADAYEFDSDHHMTGKSSLGKAIPFDASYLPDTLVNYVEEIIEGVNIYEAHNVPFNEVAMHEKVDELLLASGIERDSEDWEEAGVDLWIDLWRDKNNLPWAKYRIRVTDSQWLDHMFLGQEFRTASFAESGPWILKSFVHPAVEEEDQEGRESAAGFRHSEIPPGENHMDTEMIRRRAAVSDPLQSDSLKEMLAEHGRFLASGGSGGSFMRLHLSGMPMNVYSLSGTEGKQLEIRMKQIVPGTDLSGADLSYADLSGAICEGVNFSGAKLDGAILTDGFFTGARFDGASLPKVDFSGADLRNVSFRDASLDDADFEIANCEGADFTGARIATASFKGASLSHVKK